MVSSLETVMLNFQFILIFVVEKGNVMALDLGGTNFRVLLITLDGQAVQMKNRIYNISESIMTGHGDQVCVKIVKFEVLSYSKSCEV